MGNSELAVVIGASGGIGAALAHALEQGGRYRHVVRLSRGDGLDITDEAAVAEAAAGFQDGSLRTVIVATGVLHGDGLRPERSWRELDAEALVHAYRVNAVGPALVAKHFLPLLAPGRSVFAALSARVGSIEDNRLGGWHGYRASKAALNMLIRTLAIELARRSPGAICVGLHPGTVDTALSKPFQRGAVAERMFTPAQSAAHLVRVLDGLTQGDSGGCFAWDGARLPG